MNVTENTTMEHFLEKTRAEMDGFKARLESLRADGKKRFGDALDVVEERWRDVEHRWASLSREGEARFEKAKVDFEHARDEFARKLRELAGAGPWGM